jgi:isoleucyl-tRNA synthetase
MDWGNDYYTFSDTNIEYIWRFLKIVHERGWLYRGHRSTEWCPSCGTSISAHELVGSYEERTDPSLFVRFPLLDRPGQSLAVWTTTPWTLPANVAAAVHPDKEYGLQEDGEWVAVERYPDATFTERRRGSELVGWRTRDRLITCRRPKASSIESSDGTRSRWRRGPASYTSRPGAARRTSSSLACTTFRDHPG